MNELDEKTGPINEKGTAGPGVGQGRTIAQSGSTPKKGVGKESQLSKIAAAVNPGSMAEANPTATQSMISTFMQTFESSALELREETNDDQKELIKTMIDEITKLQTKNMKEFEKAIGKIVGITKDLQNSNNPLLQKLGKEMEEKSREEVVKASGYTLTGEKDTFLNRLGRSVGMNTDEEPVEKTREGIGKLAKGFASNIGGTLKRGFNIAVGREAPEGSFADNVFTSDEQKRERLLSRVDSESNETQSANATDTFKKVIEEYFKEEKKKSESSEKSALTEEQKKLLSEIKDRRESVESTLSIVNDKIKQNLVVSGDETKSPEEVEKSTKELDEVSEVLRQKTEELTAVMDKYEASVGTSKSPTINSEAQEDAAGISKDATIEALQKTADSNVLIQEYSNTTQEKTTETVDVLKEILELMKKMSSDNQSGAAGGDGGDDGGMDIDLPDRRRGPRRTRGRLRARARMAGRGFRGRVGGLARGLFSGGARALGMIGLGAAGAGATGAAGLGTAGAAGATGAAGAAGTAAAATKSTGLLGKIASGASSLGSKASGLLSKAPGLAKGLGFAGRVAGKLALPLAAGMAAYDGYKGFNADPNATTGQKFKNAGRNVLSGLTFGMVDSTEDKMAAGEYTGTQKKPKVGGVEPAPKNKSKVAAPTKQTIANKAEVSDKTKAEVEKTKETAKPKAVETVKEATEPKKKDASVSLDAVDKSIKGKVAEIDPKGQWAKLKDGKIVDPDFPNDADSNNSAAAAYKSSQKSGKIESKGNQTGDQMSPKKATGKTETGKNIDGTLIEQGTAETKDKVQVNVPPPTVINQGGGGGQAPPQITFPGGVGSVRTNDSSWQRFQDRRAVG